jgi:hypothetical protein
MIRRGGDDVELRGGEETQSGRGMDKLQIWL